MSMRKLLTPRNRWLVISLAGIAILWAVGRPARDEAMPREVPTTQNVAAKAAVAPPRLPLELPKRPPIGRSRADLFAARVSPPPPPLRVETEEPAAPSAPPVPYRIAGSMRYGNTFRVLLAAGDRVYEANLGEVLDGGYRVQAATPDAVTLVYMPLGTEQHLAFTASASPPAASAQSSLQSAAARTVVEYLPPPATLQGPRPPSPFPPGSPLARR
jgi:hypothetical protein